MSFDLNKLEQLTQQWKDFEKQWNTWWAVSLYQNAYDYWKQNWVNEQQLAWLQSRITSLNSQNKPKQETQPTNNTQPTNVNTNIQPKPQNTNTQTQQNIPQNTIVPQQQKTNNTAQNTTQTSQNTPINRQNTQNTQQIQAQDIQTHPEAWKFHQLYKATWWDWNKVVQDNSYWEFAKQNPNKINEIKQYFDKQNQTNQTNQDLISQSNFWAGTTPEYRQQRNQQLVDSFIKQWDFNYVDVYNEIQHQQIWASNADVVNTVNNLQQMYLQKKKESELQSTLNTPATELAKQPLTPDEKQFLQTQDPNKLEEVRKARDYQNLQNLYNKNRDLPFEKQIKESYSKLLKATVQVPNLQEEYSKLVTDNWLSQVWTKLTEAKKSVQEIKDTMDHTLKDVEKEFAWTWATSSFVRREAQKRLEWLQQQYKTATRTYDEYAWQYKQIQTNIQNQLSLKEKQYQYTQAQQQQAFQRLWIVDKLYQQEVAQKDAVLNRFLNTETQKQAQKDALALYQNKINYWLQAKYWDIKSSNPIIRKIAVENAVADTMNQFKGWTFQRSQESIVSDVQKLVDKWMSLWDAIKQNVTDKLHTNPQFNNWAANQIISHQNNTIKTVKLWNTWYYFSNWQWKPINPQIEQTNQILAQYKDWTKWWQCGHFVNNVLQAEWYKKVFWNSLESKKALINSRTPEVWSVAIMNSPMYPKYWHVAIVQKINADGSIVVKQSNGAGKELIWTQTIHNPSKILWYYNPNTSVFKQYSNAEASKYNNMSKWQYFKLSPSERKKVDEYRNWQQNIFNNPKVNTLRKLEASAWWKQMTQSMVNKIDIFQQAYNSVSTLEKHIQEANTWPISWEFTKANLWNTNTALINATAQATIPVVARWIYGEKWVLTNEDIENYKQTIPSLNHTPIQNAAIYEMNLHILRNWLINNLTNLAKSKYDVSLQSATLKWLNKDINLERDKLNKQYKAYNLKHWTHFPMLKHLTLWWVINPTTTDNVNNNTTKQDNINKTVDLAKSVANIFWINTWNKIEKSNNSNMVNDAFKLFK